MYMPMSMCMYGYYRTKDECVCRIIIFLGEGDCCGIIIG